MIIHSFFKRSTLVRQVLLHLAFWVIIVTYFAWGFGFNINSRTAFMNALLYVPGHMIIVYALVYFLIPRYLIKRKYWAFFGGLLVTLSLCTAYAWGVQLTLLANDKYRGMNLLTGRAILPFIHVAGIAISIKLLKYWFFQQQQTMEARQQKTIAELELLKSQVHPHFLFNTLNNLYAHVLEHSPRAPEIVLKLSSLLRFMIYESGAPFIPLAKEIALLQEYIALEQLRYGSRLDVSVSVDGNPEGKQVAPLLMLPLVENAFKHGASKQLDQCWISLDLHITDEGMSCKLINSKDTEEIPALPKTGGIGLQNVRKRLDILYHDRHLLTTEEDAEVFIVTMELVWLKTAIVNRPLKQPYDLEMFTG